MTSIYPATTSTSRVNSNSNSSPDSPDISPSYPYLSTSLQNSPRPGRPISGPYPSEPLPLPSPSPSSHTRPTQHNTAGIGRKVADSLQLFKESVSLPATEVINPLAFTSACSPSRRRISTHSPDDDDDVIGPHFEFVKRAEW